MSDTLSGLGLPYLYLLTLLSWTDGQTYVYNCSNFPPMVLMPLLIHYLSPQSSLSLSLSLSLSQLGRVHVVKGAAFPYPSNTPSPTLTAVTPTACFEVLK